MDLNLPINGDLTLTADGDLATVSGIEEAIQAIIRLLFTVPRETLADGTKVWPDYIFAPDYGLGLPRLIGQPFGSDFQAKFTQKMRLAILAQEEVDSSKDPEINYFQRANSIYAQVYFVALNGQRKELVFPVK